MDKPLRVVILTSIPSPYRITVFDELNRQMGDRFMVFYIARSHSAFAWKAPDLRHRHHFVYERDGTPLAEVRGMHNKLRHVDPDVIVTCGFSPPMLKAMLYAAVHRKKLVANTDAWRLNEQGYSRLHLTLRKWIYPRMSAFVPVSKKGFDNFRSYGLPANKIFISPYAIDNDFSSRFVHTEKKYDLMFSGQFIERKRPDFFCTVAEQLSKRRPGLKVLLIGDGPLRASSLERLAQSGVDFTYGGFVQKEQLPELYASARIFLFPTELDSWGVVANDACAVGTPVITCDNAGAANELVLHDHNGLVLPLDAALWVSRIDELLNDPKLYQKFSDNCLVRIRHYSPAEGARGFVQMVRYLGSPEKNPADAEAVPVKHA